MKDDLARFPTPSEAFGNKRKQTMPASSPAYGSLGDIPPPPQQRYRNASDGSGIPAQHSGHSQQNYNGYTRPAPPAPQPAKPAQAPQFQYLGQQQSHSMGFSSPQPYDPNVYQSQAAQSSQGSLGQHHQRQAPPPPQQFRPQAPHQQVPPQQQHQMRYNQQAQQQPQTQSTYVQPVDQNYQSHYPQRPASNPNQPAPEHRVNRRPVQEPIPQGPSPTKTQPERRKVKDANKVPNLRALFDDVDRQKLGYLTERELSKALVNGDYSPFDTRTVRLMIRMFDRDGDGAIYFAEFGQLWKYLHEWRNIFDRFDADGSECITLEEFSTALKAFGYTLSANSVEFMFKAGSRLSPRNGLPEMSFDMFVQTCINIKSITDIFKRYDVDRDGYVTLSFEEFMMESTKLS